jgi:hypothetical protein
MRQQRLRQVLRLHFDCATVQFADNFLVLNAQHQDLDDQQRWHAEEHQKQHELGGQTSTAWDDLLAFDRSQDTLFVDWQLPPGFWGTCRIRTHLCRGHSLNPDAPTKSMCQRRFVDVFQLATDRHAVCDAAGWHIRFFGELR